MKKYLMISAKLGLAVAIVGFGPNVSYAQTHSTHGGELPAPESSQNTYTVAPGAAGQSGSGGDAADSSKRAQNIQYAAAGISAALGTYLVSSNCNPSGNAVACAMGVTSIAQGALTAATAQGAGDTASEYSLGDWGGYPGGDYGNGAGENNGGGAGGASGLGNNYGPGGGLPAQVQQDLQAAKAALASSGASMTADGKGVKLPNGKTVPLSSLGSADGMRSAGFLDSEIGAAQDALKKAQAAAMAKYKNANALAAGGGGGGGGGGAAGRHGSGAGGDEVVYQFQGKFPWEKDKQGGTSISGMSKRLGDDKIGVAGDNIFEMISRRYKARDAAQTFLKH